MAIPFAHNIDLQGLQILNFVVHSTATAPLAPSGGQMWWENDTYTLRVYDDNELAWKGLLSGPNTSTTGNVPIWADIYGDKLSDGYSIQTTLSSSSTALTRADGIVTYVDGHIAGELVTFSSPSAGEDGYSITWSDAIGWDLTAPVDVIHDILSTVHDAVAHTPVEGDLIIANSTPAWDALARGTNNYFLVMNGNVPNWEALDISLDTTPTLGGSLNANSNDITSLDSLVFIATGEIQTGTTATNTLRLQAYDTDAFGYVTFATLTANTVPTFDLSTSTTIGNNTIVYDVGAFHDGFSDFVANEHINHTSVSLSLTGTTNEIEIVGANGDITSSKSWVVGLPSAVTITTSLTVPTINATSIITDTLEYNAGVTLLRIVAQAAHGFDDDFVYFNGTVWVKAQADVAATCATHFAINISASTFNLLPVGEIDSTGIVDDASAALVVGDFYFLSQTTAGKVTRIKPIAGITQAILIANGTNNASISIQEPYNITEMDALAEIRAIAVKVANYTIDGDDATILADCTNNTVTISLPAAPNQGQVFNIKCIDNTYTCTVSRNGGTIDGEASNRVLLVTENLTLQYTTEYGWAII